MKWLSLFSGKKNRKKKQKKQKKKQQQQQKIRKIFRYVVCLTIIPRMLNVNNNPSAGLNELITQRKSYVITGNLSRDRGLQPIYAVWNLLPQLLGQALFQKKGSLDDFHYYFVL